MRKYLLFFLAITIISCSKDSNNEGFLYDTLFNPCDERLLNYYAVSESNKDIILCEEFDDSEKWLINKDGLTSYANDGILYVETTDNTWHLRIPLEINDNMNFEIEIKQWINTSKYHRFVISEDDSLNYVDFKFNGNSEKYIDEICLIRDHNSGYSFFDFSAKGFINTEKFNTIIVRKIGNKYAFFINNKLLYIMNSPQFLYAVPRVFFMQGKNMFDYVRVSYIPE